MDIQVDLSKSYIRLLKRPHDGIRWQTKSIVDQNIIKGSLTMVFPLRLDITLGIWLHAACSC